MTNKNQLEKLAAEKNTPCVSISLNTHRTHPDNAQDEIVLKNLLKEAERRVIEEFGKRPINSLLEKIASVSNEIDHNYNFESLHIFLSNDTQEIIKSTWAVNENKVHISETFALRPIIKDYIRNEEYLILLLSQGSIKLYQALNDNITHEIKNDDFPFPEMSRTLSQHPEKNSDAKLIDDLVRENFNKLDKAIVKLYNQLNLPCLVICTEDNYSRLMQIADKPTIYSGFAPIDYNNIAIDQLAKQSWEIMSKLQQNVRTSAINEMLEAVSHGKVFSDLQEIYLAAKDGNADLLIVHEDFIQSVVMTGDRTFDYVTDATKQNAIDDITSNIAWEVISKNGRVVFTAQEKIKDLGKIVLKIRY